ncbi:TetR family transcriptional regulator [Shewanella sp. Isolate8]|uniref:TetR/AcrR family transcriptional regulator n=1 Tax=Shewanella sp. Isolate8 TaxID=2908529 RepID=UPI001EFDFC95|nr:TetR family transcriptional regulator [Shewanella sp. Isolate8]MCG9746896.1 TetR family transcriptional regulator [Shewanella sp. Isolate8]
MQQPLSYVGRITHRADGEARRVAILEATLRLIIREGVRGVRHRAVATEAQVPLASTTYYFKDIKDLISDALTYFAEKTLWMNNTLEEKSFQLLEVLKADSELMPLDNIAVHLTEFLCEHIQTQVSHKDDRILELAFHEEALRNPVLAEAIQLLDNGFIRTIEQFFTALGSSSANADAHQLLGLIRWVEYQSLISGNLDSDFLKQTVGACIDKILRAIK